MGRNGLRSAQRTAGSRTRCGSSGMRSALGGTRGGTTRRTSRVGLLIVAVFVVIRFDRLVLGGQVGGRRCGVEDFHAATANDAIHQEGRISVNDAVGLDDAHGLSRGHFEHNAFFGATVGEEHHIGEFRFGEHGRFAGSTVLIDLLRVSPSGKEGEAERKAEYLFHCR